jgi:uncharacterized membrane protein YdjX (TVP38/TMEM64 family)
MKLRLVLRGLPVLLSLVAIGYLVEVSDLGEILDQRWIDARIRGQGLDGELLFLAIGALATGVGFPRQAIAFMGGYAFGFLGGTALALLATVLGCTASFYYARLLGRRLIGDRLAGRIKRLDDFIRDNPFSMTLLIRLLPIGNNLATSLAGGLSSASGRAFILGSGIGYIPQTAVFALVGSGIAVDPGWRIGLGVVLFVISGMLGVYLYRRLRHGKAYAEEIDRELDADPGGEAPPSPSAR